MGYLDSLSRTARLCCTQSFAHGYNPKRAPVFQDATHQRARRMSHDEKGTAPRRFLIDVEETIRVVLEQEDTDGDFQISVTDAGPKLMALGTATSNGFKTFDIRVSTHVLCVPVARYSLFCVCATAHLQGGAELVLSPVRSGILVERA